MDKSNVSMIAKYRSPNSTIPYHTDTYDFINPRKFASSLRDKVILITGAGRGIGRATALAFSAAGGSVACLSRTRSDVDAVVDEVERRGYHKAMSLVGDVADPAVAARVISEVVYRLGKVDVLINNAGTSRVSDIEHEKDMSKAFHVIDVSLKGAMGFTHAVLPSMIKRKSGVIINIVSILATVNLPYFAAYSAAKAGLIRATEIMDLEMRPHNIFSYAVAPGMVADTTLGQGAFNEEALEKVEQMQTFAAEFGVSMTDSLDLPANSLVALVADEGFKLLSGRYVDVTQDLGEILKEAKKGKEGQIEKDGLYTLKVDTL